MVPQSAATGQEDEGDVTADKPQDSEYVSQAQAESDFNAAQNNQGMSEEEEEEGESNIDDYGRWKMKKFKDFARDVLLIHPQSKAKQQQRVMRGDYDGGHADAWNPSHYQQQNTGADFRSESQ